MIRILLVSALAGAAGTWLVRGLARHFGFVATPNPIVPQHQRPTAYLGGVGIGIGWGAGLVAARGAGSWVGLVLPASGFLLLGLYDDLRPLRPLHKLAAQVALAALAAALSVGYGSITEQPLIDGALRVAWIVLLVNAVNVTDVCDGLAAGIATVGSAFLGLWSPTLRPIAWSLAAANVGFLIFNSPPASIFMGDAGSHLLGFVLAMLAFPLLGRWPDALMSVAALAPFLFEVGFLIVARTSRQLPWWRGSPDHYSLRMQAAGLSRWGTVLSSWMATAVAGALATELSSISLLLHIGFLLLLAIGAWAFAVWLLQHEVRPAPRKVGR